MYAGVPVEEGVEERAGLGLLGGGAIPFLLRSTE